MKVKELIATELLVQIQNFIEQHKQMGYTAREEFVLEAIRSKLTWLQGQIKE